MSATESVTSILSPQDATISVIVPPPIMSKVAQGPRTLVCRVCGRRYSKAEHLLVRSGAVIM